MRWTLFPKLFQFWSNTTKISMAPNSEKNRAKTNPKYFYRHQKIEEFSPT